MEFRWENLAIFVGGLAPVIAVAGIVIDQEVTKSGSSYSPEIPSPPPPPPWHACMHAAKKIRLFGRLLKSRSIQVPAGVALAMLKLKGEA